MTAAIRNSALTGIVTLLLLFPWPLPGAERFTDQCRIDAGAVSANCTVTVFNAGTVVVSSIFSDSGLTIVKSNPFTADTDGRHFFYAADGQYDVQWSGGTPTIDTTTIGDVSLGTGGAHPLTSVFSRTGIVTAQSGDYTAAQVTSAARTDANNLYGAIFHEVTGLVTPATPASGKGRLFFDSADEILKIRKDTGTVVSLEGAGSPGGSDTQLQYNNSGAFGGVSAVTTDGTNISVAATGYVDVVQRVAPANPGAGTRRLFVPSTTGELSVRTSAGTTVSLEAAATGRTPESDGCVGDGVADDTSCFQTTIDTVEAAGGGLIFACNTYRTTSTLTINSNYVVLDLCGSGVIAPDITSGTVPALQITGGFLNGSTTPNETITIAGRVTASERVLTYTDASNFDVGSYVEIFFNDGADAFELITRIKAKTVNDVTHTELVQIPVDSVNATILELNPVLGVVVRNGRFEGAGTASATQVNAIQLVHTVAARIENLTIENFTKGAAVSSTNGYENTYRSLILRNSGTGLVSDFHLFADTNSKVLSLSSIDASGFGPQCQRCMYANWDGVRSVEANGRGLKISWTGYSAFSNLEVLTADGTGLSLANRSWRNNFSNIVANNNLNTAGSPCSGVWLTAQDVVHNVFSGIQAEGNVSADVCAGATDDNNVFDGVNHLAVLVDSGSGNNFRTRDRFEIGPSPNATAELAVDGDIVTRITDNSVIGFDTNQGMLFDVSTGPFITSTANITLLTDNNASDATGVRAVIFARDTNDPGTATEFFRVADDGIVALTESAGDPSCAAGDYKLKGNSSTGALRGCENGTIFNLNTAAGAASWSSLTAPTAAMLMTSDAASEQMTWDFDAAYGATDIAFLLRQKTGNVASGFVLADFRAADTDAVVLRAGDGTNGISVSQAGALTSEGTGTITATDLAADALDALAEIDGALCGTNQILEDQGASWACINTPGGGGNSFGTIGVAVADSGADTLTVTDSATINFTTTDNPEDLTADFLPAGVGSVTWLPNADATWIFDIAAAGVNPTAVFAASSIELDANLTVDDEQELRLKEEDAGGENYLGFKAPAAVTTNGICTLLDSTTDIVPDTCVGGILADELIALGSEVSGQLPVGSGGSGVATITGLIQGNGASNFTAITNSSTVGQVLRVTGASVYAWGALDLADGDAVTGTLPVGNGGTGTGTFTDGGILFGNAAAAIGVTAVLANGQLLIGDGTQEPTLANITAEAGGEVTVTNGAGSIELDIGANTLDTGEIDETAFYVFSALGNTTWGASVIDASGATSLEVPNSANPTTDAFGELAADNDAWAASRGALEHFDGTASTFVVATLASDTPVDTQVPTWNTGGTITWETPGAVSEVNDLEAQDPPNVTDNEVYVGTGAATGAWTPLNTNGAVAFNGTVFAQANIDTDLAGTLSVDQGGTGAITLTDGGILLGSGTGAVTALGVATNGQIPIGDGATDPVLATITGGTEITVVNGAGSITINGDFTPSSSDTLINKPYDTEAAGNVFTIPSYITIPVAICTDDSTGQSRMSLPTTNAATAACVTGTNAQVPSLDFDQTTGESFEFATRLPPGFTGALDMRVVYRTSVTSGTVQWRTRHSCTADGEAVDTAWSAFVDFPADTVEGTANDINIVEDTDILSGVTCNGGEIWRMQVERDVAGDSAAADARMEMFELVIRNAF